MYALNVSLDISSNGSMDGGVCDRTGVCDVFGVDDVMGVCDVLGVCDCAGVCDDVFDVLICDADVVVNNVDVAVGGVVMVGMMIE